MPMQTIACIFISKIKPQFVAVELFQVENFFHQNDGKFTFEKYKSVPYNFSMASLTAVSTITGLNMCLMKRSRPFCAGVQLYTTSKWSS